ncbi:MAG: winged helix-turn-helix transcriptional regulator [Streptosporangiaceae bacterium]
MALPREYVSEDCAIARTLEIVGERWTLLIVRDAFYGVTRFSDFRDHLDVPRAVLAGRLSLLVEHGIMARITAASGRNEYVLTAKGDELWPTIWSMLAWGTKHYIPEGRRRPYTHAGCGGSVALDGRCEACGAQPQPSELTVHPRPEPSPITAHKTDQVSRTLATPHQLLTPIAH